jgi:mannose-6-phosphate isomerase-like protein (cupin superfamily)
LAASATTHQHVERPLFDHTQGPRKLGPNDGEYVDLGSVGVRFMTYMEETGGLFSLVEHPIPPRSLCAPLHMHTREDEYSYVLEGRMGAILGDDVVYADAGDYVFKPRDQWHTFWNAGDEPCRILEIISGAPFERFFEEFGAALAAGEEPDFAHYTEEYGIHFDPASIDRICDEHGLTHPMQGQIPPQD